MPRWSLAWCGDLRVARLPEKPARALLFLSQSGVCRARLNKDDLYRDHFATWTRDSQATSALRSGAR